MLQETKSILHKLRTEGIGTSIASMHRGLDLLEQLIETEPAVATKYFKGVAAACEHISGLFLGEGFKPVKSTGKKKRIKNKPTVTESQAGEAPTNPLDYTAFLLDGMKDTPMQRSTDGEIIPEDPKASMSETASIADSLL
jgi:hypothetical protein